MPGLRSQSATLGIGSPRLTLVENIRFWAGEFFVARLRDTKHLRR